MFVEVVVRFEVITVVALEHRADESGRAVAALRAEMLDHLLLHGMLLGGTANAFDGDNFASGDDADWHVATVDGAISGFAIRTALDEGDGTRAAIAFRTTFFRAGEAGVAEIIEQGGVGRNVRDANGSAIQGKFKRTGHKLKLTKA